jgi:pantoate--beta-alanine ligase
MRTIRSIADLRAHLAQARDAGRTVGLVPTMGALHAGHEALIRTASARTGEVVVSLFVNPAQFDDPSDLERYPRTEERDAAIAAECGAAVLFAPPPAEIYPDGFATTVTVAGLSDVLEGESRPGHFAGVCTVVAKLLNIVAPDVAFFGAKDAQQAVVVRRMARDLDMPARIEVLPTVREPDGLALSSRNALLAPEDRPRALALHAGLQAAERAVAAGERDARAVRAAALAAMAERGVEPEYLALIHPETLEAVPAVNGRALLAVAARVGPVRLIDNALLTTGAS